MLYAAAPGIQSREQSEKYKSKKGFYSAILCCQILVARECGIMLNFDILFSQVKTF
jgi:hypothetical protein